MKWADINFETSELLVARSLGALRLPKPKRDHSTGGPGKAKGPGVRLAFNPPKSGEARRLVIPAFVLEALRVHRIAQKQECRAIPVEQPRDHDLVVCYVDGSMWNPESFTPRFSSATKALGFANVHYHVSPAYGHQRTHQERGPSEGGPRVRRAPLQRVHDGSPWARHPSLQREAAERVNTLYAGLGSAAV